MLLVVQLLDYAIGAAVHPLFAELPRERCDGGAGGLGALPELLALVGVAHAALARADGAALQQPHGFGQDLVHERPHLRHDLIVDGRERLLQARVPQAEEPITTLMERPAQPPQVLSLVPDHDDPAELVIGVHVIRLEGAHVRAQCLQVPHQAVLPVVRRVRGAECGAEVEPSPAEAVRDLLGVVPRPAHRVQGRRQQAYEQGQDARHGRLRRRDGRAEAPLVAPRRARVHEVHELVRKVH
mmetsp:Transcript_78811/g.228860  ORF Transcript_78811/g.228860 Transcript_78811/m.228860 type:complete len:241 (-) Transcript_78811:727-1449(-)